MLFNYKNSVVAEKDLEQSAKVLQPYFTELQVAARAATYGYHESALHLPFDKALRGQVLALAKQKKKVQEVMVVGIGGSSLGAEAIYRALSPQGVRLTFFDTIRGRELKEGAKRLARIFKRNGSVLLNIISKSGSTIETIANAKILLSALQKITKQWADYVVVTTEPGSRLELWARKNRIAVLPNPKLVGGRFSVFSPVGVFPLALSGVEIGAWQRGAAKMIEQCLRPDIKSNPALQSAAVIFTQLRAGKNILDTFFFHPDLEGLGKWYRQLVAESLGKDGQGIMPTISIGSSDLHSLAQLYLAGPKDKLTSFVSVAKAESLKLPALDSQFETLVPELKGKTTADFMSAVYAGTKQAYANHGLPFMEIILTKLSAEEIGAFMQFKMIETMLLAKLMGVNAFDQPAVEEYKVITRQLLV